MTGVVDAYKQAVGGIVVGDPWNGGNADGPTVNEAVVRPRHGLLEKGRNRAHSGRLPRLASPSIALFPT